MNRLIESGKVGIFLLSAGEGRRLRPLTTVVPKPTLPFLGRPMVSYVFDFLWDRLPLELRPASIVANTFHLPEQLKKSYKLIFADKNIVFSDESELLGSGGGIHFAQPFLKDFAQFFVVNADTVLFSKDCQIVNTMLQTFSNSRAIATLLVMRHPEAGKSMGAVVLDNQTLEVRRFVKKTDVGFHFVGVVLLRQTIFKYFKAKSNGVVVEENLLYETLMSAKAQGETVNAVIGNLEWYETGDPKSFIEAATSIKSRSETTSKCSVGVVKSNS